MFCPEAIALVENRLQGRIWLNSDYSKEKWGTGECRPVVGGSLGRNSRGNEDF